METKTTNQLSNSIARCDSSDEHGNDTSGPCSSEGGSEDGSGNTNGKIECGEPECNNEDGSKSCSSDGNGEVKLTPKQVFTELQKMDWSPVIYKLKQELKSEPSQELMNEFFKFYSLCVAGKNKGYAPSASVDTVWHLAINNTVFYRALGKKFGKFIDHVPRVSDEKAVLSKMKNSFNQTMNDYQECFGEPNSKIWGLKGTKECSEGSENSCGSESKCQSNKANIDCSEATESKCGSESKCQSNRS